jgi:hypothetical protein
VVDGIESGDEGSSKTPQAAPKRHKQQLCEKKSRRKSKSEKWLCTRVPGYLNTFTNAADVGRHQLQPPPAGIWFLESALPALRPPNDGGNLQIRVALATIKVHHLIR